MMHKHCWTEDKRKAPQLLPQVTLIVSVYTLILKAILKKKNGREMSQVFQKNLKLFYIFKDLFLIIGTN